MAARRWVMIMAPAMATSLFSGGIRLGARSRAARIGRYERVTAYWNDDKSPLSRRLAAMLEAMPSLASPTYVPTPWARSSKANFLLATVRSRLGALRRNVEPPLINRTTACAEPDVLVEWAKDETATALPNDAPIVVFLHTITGTAAQTRWLMTYASSRGWRSCVFVRRGHGRQRLSSPAFNLLGTPEDVELQLAAVRQAYPSASLCVSLCTTGPSALPAPAHLGMVGISAGSGLLINYLGRAGAQTPVDAACAICPAWSVQDAFERMGETDPLAERAMVNQIQAHFVRRNRRVLQAWDPQATEACLEAKSLPELLEAHAPFAMRMRGATADDYYRAHDPMRNRHGVAVPLLVLNAEDDFVCPASLAQPDVILKHPGSLLLITRSGSHVAFNEGRLGRKSFHGRVSMDFLDAARVTAAMPIEDAHTYTPIQEVIQEDRAEIALEQDLAGQVVPTHAAMVATQVDTDV